MSTLVHTSSEISPATVTTLAAEDYAAGAGAQTPSLATIDAAILQAVAAGDRERATALVATRAAVALGEILAALPATETDRTDGAAEEDAHDDNA